jgi:hypothetical protein
MKGWGVIRNTLLNPIPENQPIVWYFRTTLDIQYKTFPMDKARKDRGLNSESSREIYFNK